MLVEVLDVHGEPHSLDLWQFAVDVNLTGTFNLTRLACKYLAQVEPEGPDGERGVIIMVASSAAVRPLPSLSPHIPFSPTHSPTHPYQRIVHDDVVRRPTRPISLRRNKGRPRKPHPPHVARPRAARHPRRHHRSGRIRVGHDGQDGREDAGELDEGVGVPEEVWESGGVCGDGGVCGAVWVFVSVLLCISVGWVILMGLRCRNGETIRLSGASRLPGRL